MFTLVLLFSLVAPSLVSSSGIALAPRTSAVYRPYHDPDYFCPARAESLPLLSENYRLSENSLDSGSIKYSDEGCADMANDRQSPTCGFRCALKLDDGSALTDVTLDPRATFCSYTGDITCRYNGYNNDDDVCLPIRNTNCDKRSLGHYRHEDNYTAWRKKRDARAQRQVVPRPIPS
ncbi:hypothetical protein BKA62DRAFT_671017 [Auriculariales sp. MPI-PUGE-AT-0066]|nr:hypothetical protein BKA62DRAFT_671017 [Auriculariales sp. MPI-PUGE-AT-0066]